MANHSFRSRFLAFCALCAASPMAFAAPGAASPPVTAEIVRPDNGEFRLGTAPVRFWGLALRETPPLTERLPDGADPGTDPDADAFLLRIQTAGANFLRLAMPSPGEDADAEERQRALDRVLARSRAAGVHVWMGASRVLGTVTSNSVSVLDDPASADAWAASFSALPDGVLWLDGALARAWDPRLEILEINRLSSCVNHFNPFTGRFWSDDPAVVLWELEGPDGWHSRMKAGEARLLPSATIANLLAQFDRWLYAKYGADNVPDPVPDEDRPVFLADLWTSHKSRVAEQFRLNGASTRLATLAWRENSFPDIRPDDSGCLVVYARPGDIPAVEVPQSDVAALRVWTPPAGIGGVSPDAPWGVLATASRFGAIAWDADLPGDAPRAFDVAFATAGDAFRAQLDVPASALVSAPDGSAATLRRKGLTWDRASHTNALDIVGTGLALAVPPAADPAPDAPPPESLAAALFQTEAASLSMRVAVEPASDAVLVITPAAAEDGALWRDLPVAYDIRALSGAVLATGTVETLPHRMSLPATAFRIDFQKDEGARVR